MDIHKELYDIMNYYLGEKDRRNNVRLPNQYEEFKSAIGKLLTHAFRAGKSVGSQVVCEKIKTITNTLWDVQEDFLKEVKDNKPNCYIGRELEGYLNRNPKKENEKP